MIKSFDGWKEALLELKALKNLTDFLNNPSKALQIKAMDLLEEFSTENQVAMMQEGLIQALLQTVVVNEDEGVQGRALDYLGNISGTFNQPTLCSLLTCVGHQTFMEIMCTSKDGSIVDGFGTLNNAITYCNIKLTYLRSCSYGQVHRTPLDCCRGRWNQTFS